MKTILFLLFFFSFSNAEYLLTLQEDNNKGTLIYCIKDYSYSTNQFSFTDITDINYSLDSQLYQSIDIKEGYINNNGSCYIDKSKLFGFEYEQFNLLMALYGIFLSSLIAFGLIKAY